MKGDHKDGKNELNELKRTDRLIVGYQTTFQHVKINKINFSGVENSDHVVFDFSK